MKIFNSKKIFWLCFLGLVFFIIDRVLKNLSLAGKIFFYKNSGLTFSLKMPENLWPYFYLLTIIILFFIFWQIIKAFESNHLLLTTGYLVLVMGIISNLIDRLKFGFIIDYLNFYFFYNNLADIMIGSGVLILILQLICQSQSDKCLK